MGHCSPESHERCVVRERCPDSIMLSLMFLVFLVLDDYNPMMDFLTNPVSKALLAALCATSIFSSFLLISDARKAGKSPDGAPSSRVER